MVIKSFSEIAGRTEAAVFADGGREEVLTLTKREKLQGLIFHKDFVQWFPVETEEYFLICTGRGGIARLAGGSLLPGLPE